MRLAIIGSRGYPYIYSGYETFVKELSERLVKKGINVTVYCHKNLFEKQPKKLNGINLIYIPTFKSKYLSQLVHSFLSFIHCIFIKPDLILVVNVANGPLGIIPKIFGIPTLINVDGLEWLRPKWKGLGSIYFKFAARMATIFYNKIINDSDQMRKIYLELFNKDSKVIAYGPSKIKGKNFKLTKNFGVIPREYYLVIGRLVPDNNADKIIEEFIRSKSSKKLVIVGDVPYNDNYASTVKNISNPQIIITGYVKDSSLLCQLYKNCYAYIHGHEYGGTNPTMINAMYYGTAILALKTPFNKEMLQNGKYGLLFEKKSNSLRELINYSDTNHDKLSVLRKNSLRGITKKYNWEYITKSYISEFKSIVSRV